METKKNCIAEIIHHIATILGFFIAGYYFLQKRTKTFCKVLLSVHMVTQGYGILKIIGDTIDGKKRFMASFEHVSEVCNEKEGAGRVLRGFCYRRQPSLSLEFRYSLEEEKNRLLNQ